MKISLAIIGILLFAFGIAAGIYVGFWVMFIGGIMEIIDTIKAPVTQASEIGFGVLRMFFAGAVAGFTFWFCALISGLFIIAAVD